MRTESKRRKKWRVAEPVVVLEGACIVRVRNRWYSGTVRRVEFILSGPRRGYWQYGVQREGRRQWNWVGDAEIRPVAAMEGATHG